MTRSSQRLRLLFGAARQRKSITKNHHKHISCETETHSTDSIRRGQHTCAHCPTYSKHSDSDFVCVCVRFYNDMSLFALVGRISSSRTAKLLRDVGRLRLCDRLDQQSAPSCFASALASVSRKSSSLSITNITNPSLSSLRPMSSAPSQTEAADGGGPERRVLSIQSHVVHGYVGNKSATFPLQVRELWN